MTAATPATGDLVRLAIRLRWQLVSNRARRTGRRSGRFSRVLIGLYALGNIIGLSATRFASESATQRAVILLVSSMASGWIFGPILTGGVDETVDPTRLALMPLNRRQLFTIQLTAALSGVPPLAALAGVSIGLTVGLAPAGLGALVVVLAAPVTVVMVAGFARLLASALAIAQRSRAGRDIAVVFAALTAGALFVTAQLATNLTAGRADSLVRALSWAPWSWPARAALAASSGDLTAGFGWLAASFAACAIVLATWASASRFLLHHGERVVRTGRRGRGPVLHGATTPLGAALARQWIYLRRSPNTRVALLFGVAFGVAFPVLQILQYGAEGSSGVAFSALLAMLTNVGATSNLLGFDAGSLWIETLAGGPGRTHMVARSLAALPNLLIPTWLSGVVVGVWVGGWTEVALVSAVAVPVAVIICAQGLVTSVLAPWPLSDGDNPFGNKQGAEGRGARLAITALSGLGSGLVLSAPIIATAYFNRDAGWIWAVPFAGLIWAGVVATVVVVWLGRHLRGREPHLIEVLSPLAVS